MRSQARRHFVTLLAVMLAASGCTTTTPVWTGDTSTDVALPLVDAGDQVVLVMNSGRELKCSVDHVDQYEARMSGLYDCRKPIALENVREVRFRKIDGQRTITLPDLRRGDDVTVDTRTGQTQRFRVTTVDRDAVHGEGVTIGIDEIQAMEVRRFSLGRSAGAVAGALLTVAAVGFYLMVRQLSREEE